MQQRVQLADNQCLHCARAVSSGGHPCALCYSGDLRCFCQCDCYEARSKFALHPLNTKSNLSQGRSTFKANVQYPYYSTCRLINSIVYCMGHACTGVDSLCWSVTHTASYHVQVPSNYSSSYTEHVDMNT
jgi:hypothetical protein